MPFLPHEQPSLVWPSTIAPTSPQPCEEDDFKCHKHVYMTEKFAPYVFTTVAILIVIVFITIIMGFGICIFFKLDDKRWERRVNLCAKLEKTIPQSQKQNFISSTI